MKKRVELPLAEPFYSTYHNHAVTGAASYFNPTLRNWYLNEVMQLSCERTFTASYFTTPRIGICGSSWSDCPYFERVYYDLRFFGGYVNYVIRNLLDGGYYVCFGGPDDFYIKGKTWYHKRHFDHDGMICGYDMNDGTYSVYAYDENWVCRKFKTPQKAFVRAVKSTQRRWNHGYIEGIKPKNVLVEFSAEKALENIKKYLDSSFEKYPQDCGEKAYGAVVNDYAAIYADKLYRKEIPYEKTDRRFMRMIWEHKRGMAERIVLIEKAFGLDNSCSEEYGALVQKANGLRLAFASHCLKRRDSVLFKIRDGLYEIAAEERKILNSLIDKTS